MTLVPRWWNKGNATRIDVVVSIVMHVATTIPGLRNSNFDSHPRGEITRNHKSVLTCLCLMIYG